MKTRIEVDFIGEKEIPAEAYYGVQTARGAENFDITGIKISSAPHFIKALAHVKKACALANKECGVLEANIADAIVKASEEIIEGKLHDQFISDCIQGGAGTSTNMNANEVIANRALELMGEEKGRYDIVSPNDHVNCSQSTNDAYPTAFRVALYMMLTEFMEKQKTVITSFEKKAVEFDDILKMGRTHLQDAVPMTVGQEFGAYATTISEDIERVAEVRDLITAVNIGATAIGTGLNAPEGYSAIACKHLAESTGIPLQVSPNLVEATWDCGAYVQISGVMKRCAAKISKICNDLRLYASGPRCGFNELNLPQLQPGSSIMPGKVNPVIPEVVNQSAFYVMGMDTTITWAAEAGQLQLNVMEPVMAYAQFQQISILGNAYVALATRCVDGITVNEEVCRNYALNSIGIVTALNPVIGYKKAAALAKEAFVTGRGVYDLLLEKGWVEKDKLDEILSPENLKHPKFIK